MVERKHRFGQLVFDRDTIVRAALRAHIELRLAKLDPLKRHRFTSAYRAEWEGNLQRGAFNNDNGEGDYEVVSWTEADVVGLAYELGFGPIEQLDLEIDAVTGGPDDVRAAVPGLPTELEPAFLMAVDQLEVGPHHGEKQAGVGFWLLADRLGGSFFDFKDPTLAWGADRLAVWGKLRSNRLQAWWDREHVERCAEAEQTEAAPIHAIIDAVTARVLLGPTELTPDELATLCPTPPNPQQLLHTQEALRKVGITLPALAASP